MCWDTPAAIPAYGLRMPIRRQDVAGAESSTAVDSCYFASSQLSPCFMSTSSGTSSSIAASISVFTS